MRVLHTADWHLGQTLHGVSRAHEHARFLHWLLDQVERHEVDALIVAGDVFDVASPSAEAQAMYFGFLADARRRFVGLDIAVVGGNHDAPTRLDAAQAILSALGVHVVGGLPRRPDGTWDLERLLVPLHDREGRRGARLIALPFLRPKDLPSSRAEARTRAGLPPSEDDEADHDLDEAGLEVAHAEVYRALVEAAAADLDPEVALIATGHAYVAGGQLSELSERKIQQGNQRALPPSVFPPRLAYVALGHLHLAQRVCEAPEARYSGSPIPLSMAELDYPHQVLLVDLDGPRLTEVRAAAVPRFVELLRIPAAHAPLEEVLPLLQQLPRSGPEGASAAERPLLEVRVRLERARPRLRQDVEGALEGAWARLVRIDVVRADGDAEARLPRAELSDLAPEEVFRAAHRRAREGEPSPALVAAFRELLEAVEHDSR